jgi:tetratricopeptide (TPR) repeat protein
MSLLSFARRVAAALIATCALALVILGWTSDWNIQTAALRVGQLWADYSSLIDRFYTLLDQSARFITPIATIAGAVYGIYHKWQYSRSRMHVHIQDFLRREDERLTPAREALEAVVTRPGPAHNFTSPIFSEQTLEPTLRQMRLGQIGKADDALKRELTMLGRQLEQWGNLEAHYNRRKSQAHLLKGAIAASRAATSQDTDGGVSAADVEALNHFKAAYELDKSDLDALEYMGHQHMKLGDNASALAIFERMEMLAQSNGDTLLRVRSLKFQAIVRENEGTKKIVQNPNLNKHLEPNLQTARDDLSEALDELPDGLRGGLEAAELNELRGRVQQTRTAFQPAVNSYRAAWHIYNTLKNSSTDQEVRSTAALGLGRTKNAINEIILRPLDAPRDDDENNSTAP